jgi:general secretion pathway protein E
VAQAVVVVLGVSVAVEVSKKILWGAVAAGWGGAVALFLLRNPLRGVAGVEGLLGVVDALPLLGSDPGRNLLRFGVLVGLLGLLGLGLRWLWGRLPASWRAVGDRGVGRPRSGAQVERAGLDAVSALGASLREVVARPDPDVILLVDRILAAGLSLGASDVHILPGARGTRISARIEGDLRELATLDAAIHAPMVSRIKILAGMTIYKTQLPQDGRINFQEGRHAVRVSTLPTNHGEKVVMRLASQDDSRYELDALEMSAAVLLDYKALLARSQGVIILTGPTGSGKTTTLYASLLHIQATRGERVNIVTLENPIEYDFEGFSQTQIDDGVGLTFAEGLRSLLRQDPDVIMVGEVRDEETAENVMRAAMTGHLLLTTVHADSAAGVFNRLIQIGVDPVNLAQAVCAVISQRLCQRLCPHCREEEAPGEVALRRLAQLGVKEAPEGPFYVSRGCRRCQSQGHQGRVALYEMLRVSNALRDQIHARKLSHQLQEAAREEGMGSLLEDGLAKARAGQVSLQEVLRVVSE